MRCVKASVRRDRLLLCLAPQSGLFLGFLTGPRLWQRNYYFAVERNDTFPYPLRSDRVGDTPKPYTPIDADSTFSKIVPFRRSLPRLLRFHLASFADLEDRDSFLYPVIRKNDHPRHNASIMPRDAHKILKHLQAKVGCTGNIGWHVLRQVAVRRCLREGLPLQ